MKFTSTIYNRLGLTDFIVLFSLSSATTKLKNLDFLLQGEADHSKQACIMAKYSRTLIALFLVTGLVTNCKIWKARKLHLDHCWALKHENTLCTDFHYLYLSVHWGNAVLDESFLSFMNFNVNPKHVSWKGVVKCTF